MTRESNAMSEAELRDFLAAVEWVALGVLDADGAPAGGLAPAAVDGDRLFFGVGSGSAAEAALARDPRCCVSADVFPSYYEIKGATVHGRAGRAEPPPAIAAELASRARRHGLAADVVYALPLLDDAFGFDFAKLARR
jgi:hypothetical protein